MESILDSIKLKLGLSGCYDVFDSVIISHINTALFVLWQLGVGKDKTKPFKIHDSTEKWNDFVEDELIESCKDDVYIRVKLLFDPPTNSFLVENLNRQKDEYEWRMTVAMDEYNSRATEDDEHE